MGYNWKKHIRLTVFVFLLLASSAFADGVRIDGKTYTVGDDGRSCGWYARLDHQVWHCHPHGPTPAEQERDRKAECKKLLKKIQEWKDDINNPYRRKVLAKKCVDQETPVGKHICDYAQKNERKFVAGMRRNIEHYRRKAAQVCTPSEMSNTLN